MTFAPSGSVLGRFLNDGQIAVIMSLIPVPPWYVFTDIQNHAITCARSVSTLRWGLRDEVAYHARDDSKVGEVVAECSA